MQNWKAWASRRVYGLAGASAGFVGVAWFYFLYCPSCGTNWDEIPLWPILLIPSYAVGSLVGMVTGKWVLALAGGLVGVGIGTAILYSYFLPA